MKEVNSVWLHIPKAITTGTDSNNKPYYIPSFDIKVICPEGVRPEILERITRKSEKDFANDPELKKVKSFAQATPSQNYELAQFPNADEIFNKNLSRNKKIDYWQENGKSLFEALGLPMEEGYPYFKHDDLSGWNHPKYYINDVNKVQYWYFSEMAVAIAPDFIDDLKKIYQDQVAAMKKQKNARRLSYEIDRVMGNIKVIEEYQKNKKQMSTNKLLSYDEFCTLLAGYVPKTADDVAYPFFVDLYQKYQADPEKYIDKAGNPLGDYEFQGNDRIVKTHPEKYYRWVPFKVINDIAKTKELYNYLKDHVGDTFKFSAPALHDGEEHLIKLKKVWELGGFKDGEKGDTKGFWKGKQYQVQINYTNEYESAKKWNQRDGDSSWDLLIDDQGRLVDPDYGMVHKLELTSDQPTKRRSEDRSLIGKKDNTSYCWITIEARNYTNNEYTSDKEKVILTIPEYKVKVICPDGVREEFLGSSHLLRQKGTDYWKEDPLYEIYKFSEASASQLYELLQFGHPCEMFGEKQRPGWNEMECDEKELDRGKMIKYWDKNGQKLFYLLNFPTAEGYPYINKHVGQVKGFTKENQKYWSTADHELPVSLDFTDELIKIYEDHIAKFKAAATKKVSFSFDIELCQRSIEVLKNYSANIKDIHDKIDQNDLSKPADLSKLPAPIVGNVDMIIENFNKSYAATKHLLEELSGQDWVRLARARSVGKTKAESILAGKFPNGKKMTSQDVTNNLEEVVAATEELEALRKTSEGSEKKLSLEDLKASLKGARTTIKYLEGSEKSDTEAWIKGLEVAIKYYTI